MKKPFQNLRQAYGDLKLQSKFTISLMLIVTIPILILGMLFYGKLYHMVVSDTIRQEQDASATTAPLIEETLQEVLDTYSELSSQPFFRNLFHMPVDQSLSTLAGSSQAEDFQKQTQAVTAQELITGFRIYVDIPNEDSELFQNKNTKDIFAPMRLAQGRYWYGIFRSSPQTKELFCPPFYLGTKEQEALGDMAYIRALTMYSHGLTYPAYVAVYFSADTLTKVLSENLSLKEGVSYIINDRNAMVATSDASLSSIYWIDYTNAKKSVMSSNNFIERTILDETVYAGFYNIPQSDWFMVTVLPSAPLIKQSNTIMLQYVLFYIGFLVLAFFFASRLSYSITNRLSSVVVQMQNVRHGPPVPMESPSAHDEIGDLIDTYNYMTRKMNQLMEKQAQNAEDLRIAEFNSLQAQINPHFLYNTMDMINWLAQQGRTSEVSNAVQNLSRFYKLTLSRKENISTIAKEIEHVSIYVRLQNMRFHDNIQFIWDIPDELTQYPIPKLTLQPVVENSILHGILEKESKSGSVLLTGWMEASDIVLLVSDDGVGIPPEKMPSILTGMGQSASGGTNIAIYNTHRRLQILYGSKYGLTYSSEPGKGTEVQIRIPAQREYQNPYMKAADAGARTPAFPIVTVTDRQPGVSKGRLSPETLLNYSQQLTQNLYNIRNLHQISPKLQEGENLYILAHEVSSDFPSHTHGYFELNYVCSGAVMNIIDGNEIYMEAGDLLFLNQKAVQALKYLQPDTLLVNFCLDEGIFSSTLQTFYQDDNPISSFFRGSTPTDQNCIFFSLGSSLEAQSILTSMIQEYADNNFRHSYLLEAMLLLLFSHLASAEEYSYYGTDLQTHQMLQYLKEHCMETSLEAIAEHFHLSAQQLDAHLQKHTGRDSKSFIQEVQLDRALTLLQRPDLNIFQIAQSCGYQNTEEFFAVFDRKFHLSPTEYRKQFL